LYGRRYADGALNPVHSLNSLNPIDPVNSLNPVHALDPDNSG
jgi:hypothetical protein